MVMMMVRVIIIIMMMMILDEKVYTQTLAPIYQYLLPKLMAADSNKQADNKSSTVIAMPT